RADTHGGAERRDGGGELEGVTPAHAGLLRGLLVPIGHRSPPGCGRTAITRGRTIACLAKLPKSTTGPGLGSYCSSAALAAGGGQQLFELFQAPEQGVALDGDLGELPLTKGRPLILLDDLRLQLRLALVEVFQLGLEAGDALLGREIADKEDVEHEQQENGARGDEEPGKARDRRGGHPVWCYAKMNFSIIFRVVRL